jgi:hypothetical protein
MLISISTSTPSAWDVIVPAMPRHSAIPDIEHFGFELSSRERALKSETVGFITIEQERGPEYEQHIVPYIEGVLALRRAYTRIQSPIWESR